MPTSEVRFPETFREKAATRANPQGMKLSIRELSQLSGVSYEQIRKAWSGEPVLSEKLCRILCELLGIPHREMWADIQLKKLNRKYPKAVVAQAAAASRTGPSRTPRSTISRAYRVKYSRTALVFAADALTAATSLRDSKPELVNVDACSRILVNAEGTPVVGVTTRFDETLVAEGNPPRRLALTLTHREGRLLYAAILAADDKVGIENLVTDWVPTEGEVSNLKARISGVIQATTRR